MHADQRELKKARACIVHLLDKVDLSIMYSLSHSLSQGVRVLKKVTEQMWLCDMKICSRLLQIAEDSMMARKSLWPRLLCILPTKHLRSASVEDIVNNSFSRDLFVTYKLHFGQNPVPGVWAQNPVLNDKARVHGEKSSCSLRV
jgi:hypothetical protein